MKSSFVEWKRPNQQGQGQQTVEDVGQNMPIKSVEINCADSKGLQRLGKRNERDLKRVKKRGKRQQFFPGATSTRSVPQGRWRAKTFMKGPVVMLMHTHAQTYRHTLNFLDIRGRCWKVPRAGGLKVHVICLGIFVCASACVRVFLILQFNCRINNSKCLAPDCKPNFTRVTQKAQFYVN